MNLKFELSNCDVFNEENIELYFKKYGICVTVTFKTGNTETYHNVTELHFNYNRHRLRDENRVAIESDIHATGVTILTSSILDIQVKTENSIQEIF